MFHQPHTRWVVTGNDNELHKNNLLLSGLTAAQQILIFNRYNVSPITFTRLFLIELEGFVPIYQTNDPVRGSICDFLAKFY